MNAEVSIWSAKVAAQYVESYPRSNEQPTQTLLVTDLKGFTKLLDQTDDEYARVVIQEHNRILRQCLYEHQGIESAHTGDGVIASFDSVDRALHCAIAMQRSFERHNQRGLLEPLHVRVGLHVGRPLLDDNRLFGKCVNTAVRLCATARPGQVVASELVRAQSVNDLRFLPLGARKLKGLSDPLEIYELQWDAAS